MQIDTSEFRRIWRERHLPFTRELTPREERVRLAAERFARIVLFGSQLFCMLGVLAVALALLTR